ncbi:hypothetical protein [Gordonia sp. OPL2]|nr:hypothetical protein [Gordonia sp. OPL2]
MDSVPTAARRAPTTQENVVLDHARAGVAVAMLLCASSTLTFLTLLS